MAIRTLRTNTSSPPPVWVHACVPHLGHVSNNITDIEQVYEIVGGKDSALNNLNCNFTETIMNTNKIIPGN